MHAEQLKVAEHAERAEQDFSKRAERAEQPYHKAFNHHEQPTTERTFTH